MADDGHHPPHPATAEPPTNTAFDILRSLLSAPAEAPQSPAPPQLQPPFEESRDLNGVSPMSGPPIGLSPATTEIGLSAGISLVGQELNDVKIGSSGDTHSNPYMSIGGENQTSSGITHPSSTGVNSTLSAMDKLSNSSQDSPES